MSQDPKDLPHSIDITHWTPQDRLVKWRYSRERTILAEIIGFELWPRTGFKAKLMTKGSEFPSGTGGIMTGVLWNPKPEDKNQDWVWSKPGEHYEFLFMPADIKKLLDIKSIPQPTLEEVKKHVEKEVDPFVEDTTTEGAKATPLPGGQSKPTGRVSAVPTSRTSGLRPDNAAATGETAAVSN